MNNFFDFGNGNYFDAGFDLDIGLRLRLRLDIEEP
jgi:hypothetical protein